MTGSRHRFAVYSDDDAITGGIQHISIGGGHVIVRVVDGVAYFTGDQLGLIKFGGVPANEAAVDTGFGSRRRTT